MSTRLARIFPFSFFLVGSLAGIPVLIAVLHAQPPFTVGGCNPDTPMLGTIQLMQPALADGKPLAAGTYQVRLTAEHPTPAQGQSEKAACWVEFLRQGVVVGREVASVIPAEEIDAIAEGPRPMPNTARVDLLKGGEYVRVWINHTTTNYIIHLPVAGTLR